MEEIMPDIALCTRQVCPLKEKCYRHEATPEEYQTYAMFEYDYNINTCEYFMPIKEEKNK